MKRMHKLMIICSAFLFVSSLIFAGEIAVDALTTFESNTPALAAEVNDNFTVVKTAVNDNDAGVTALETATADMAHKDGTLQTNLNADKLDNQTGSFYQSASNITAGTLNNARFSAYSDLSAEGYLGNASGDVARNNGITQVNLSADKLDGYHYTSFIRTTGGTISGNLYATGDLRSAIYRDYNNTSRYIDLSSTGTSMYAQGGLRLGAATVRTTSNGGHTRNIIIRHFVSRTYTNGTVIFQTPDWQVIRTGTYNGFQLKALTSSSNYWYRNGTLFYNGVASTGQTFNFTVSYQHFEIWLGKSIMYGNFAHLHLNRYSTDYYWDGYIVTTYTN